MRGAQKYIIILWYIGFVQGGALPARHLRLPIPPIYGFCGVPIFMIFGRTDLRIGVSKAKFDEQADFKVRLAVAPQKPRQKSKKLSKLQEKHQTSSFWFFGVFRPPSVVLG